MVDLGGTARRMWTLFEPVHAVTYFAPDALGAYQAAGLRGFWRGYFAGRAAPLAVTGADGAGASGGGSGAGAGAGPGVVTAAFYNFAPAFVGRALPSVWELISPEDALRVRREGAVAALGGLLAGQDAEVKAAAGLLERALNGLDYPGRVLGAANAALIDGGAMGVGAGPAEVGDSDLGRLWQAATTLREHRGDGHFAAVLAAGLDGCEVLVLRCGLDMARETMQPIRGWSDEQWDAAQERLADRGLVDADGAITEAGRELHVAVEQATDRAAERPWARLGDAGVTELAEALTPLAVACAQVVPYPSPIGVPKPA
jgi:hypothetical protein